MRRDKDVLLVVNPMKPGVKGLLASLLPWLQRQARVVGVDRNRNGSLKKKADCDLVVVLGGDGTLLSVARRLEGLAVPVLGVNVGRLGFLTDVYPDEAREAIVAAIEGRARVTSRMMMRCVVRQGSRRREFQALNDTVVNRGSHARMITLNVRIDGEHVSHHSGDGLIVSTATGSTAYNLSAGGPILSEHLKAFILCPICAHTLASRPIVISGEERIEIAPTSRSGHMNCFVDGQVSCHLRDGDVVEITRSPNEFHLVTLGRRGRYEIIRDKLHWAGWIKERERK